MAKHIAAFDPVQVFEQTIIDLASVVNTFKADDSTMTAAEFLQATRTVGERLRAVSMLTMSAVVGPVNGKIPYEVRRQFEDQVELDSLMATPEDEHEKMMKALREIATFRSLSKDDFRPGDDPGFGL